MISARFAHISGIPIEETLGSLGPALLVAFGAAWAQLRAHLRKERSPAPRLMARSLASWTASDSDGRATPTLLTTSEPDRGGRQVHGKRKR
jgi:hypothetical protein